MKICPQCQTEYDDYMSFCMQDGTPLADENLARKTGAATEVYDFPPDSDHETEAVTEERSGLAATAENESVATQTASKETAPSRAGLGVLLGVLGVVGLILLGAAVGGVWWYLGGSGDEVAVANSNAQTNQPAANSSENPVSAVNANRPDNTNADNKPTPTPSPTPKPTPSPTPSPSPTATKTPSAEASPSPTPESKPTPTPRPADGRPIGGGVVNGKATSLPKPAYPAAARAVGASGTVNVRVLIDENGNVVNANAVNGHPLLRGSAEQAARRAKFRPTSVGGQAVKVSGVIVYVFRPN